MKHFDVYGKNNCKFCDAAKSLLESKNLPYDYINIENSEELKQDLIDKVQSMTLSTPKSVPQIFLVSKKPDLSFGVEYVGGFDQLKELLTKEEE